VKFRQQSWHKVARVFNNMVFTDCGRCFNLDIVATYYGEEQPEDAKVCQQCIIMQTSKRTLKNKGNK